MRVLSFDVGTKNLALCDLTVGVDTFRVNKWTVESTLTTEVNVNLTPIQDLAPQFYNFVVNAAKSWLFEDGNPNDIEFVYIENQPMGTRGGAARNLKTKVLSHMLQCVIVHLRPDVTVSFIHPGLKLKDMERLGKSTYRENKAYAVTKTLEIVGSRECLNPECVALVTKTKKDDLADAFLQGLIAGRMQLSGAVVAKKEPPVKKAKAKPKSKKRRIVDTVANEALEVNK
jgi:hypothetical protein